MQASHADIQSAAFGVDCMERDGKANQPGRKPGVHDPEHDKGIDFTE